MSISQLKQNNSLAASLPIPFEFMDTTGKYVFRAYLGPEPDYDSIQGIIDRVLTDVVAAWPDRTNDELYEEVHARLCGSEPMEREPLLLFMGAFMEALKKQLHAMATGSLTFELASDRSTAPDLPAAEIDTDPKASMDADTNRDFLPGMSTSLSCAALFPRTALLRLDRLSEYRKDRSVNAKVYELFDLIGCTDLEISLLLCITEEKASSRRRTAMSEIRRGEPGTVSV